MAELAAKVSFQASNEPRLNEASTAASPAMKRPRVRGANHELDVLLLAVSGPLSCVVEMPGDDLLQRGGGPQGLEVGRSPSHASELFLALIWSVPVGGDGSVHHRSHW
jgi:hypothetical protein